MGSFLILVSAFLFSTMTLMVALAGERGIPSFQMMAIRCFVQIFYSGFLCLWVDINPFGTKGNRTLPFLRGLLGPFAAGIVI